MQRGKAAALKILLWGGMLASLLSLAPAQSAHDESVLVVQGARILPITSPPIVQGVLVIQGGKIVAWAKKAKSRFPPAPKSRTLPAKLSCPESSTRILTSA